MIDAQIEYYSRLYAQKDDPLSPDLAETMRTVSHNTGEADDSLFAYDPVNFEVGLGFPQLAKLALGGVVALIFLVVGVIWFVVRRVQWHKRLEK